MCGGGGRSSDQTLIITFIKKNPNLTSRQGLSPESKEVPEKSK